MPLVKETTREQPKMCWHTRSIFGPYSSVSHHNGSDNGPYSCLFVIKASDMSQMSEDL